LLTAVPKSTSHGAAAGGLVLAIVLSATVVVYLRCFRKPGKRKAKHSNKTSRSRAEAAMDESDFGGGGFDMEMNEAAIAAAKSSNENSGPRGDTI